MTTTARRTLRWQAATVLAIRDEAPRVKTFRLRPEHVSDHLPGQYYVLRLTAPDGYTAQRSYSIASPPDGSAEIELTVERLDDGEVSEFLHDVVVDMLRKRDRRPCSPAGLAFESAEYPIGTASADEFEQISLRMELHHAIERLPAQQRKCIQLHYLLDYSVDEVASALGVAASTVRSHLATARTALASRLGIPDDEPAANEKGTNG